MKLWQKIVVYSLLLFIPALLCFGIAMIENNRKTAVTRIIKQTGIELSGISMGLIKYVMTQRVEKATGYGTQDEKYINDYFENQTDTWRSYLKISNEKKVLYSNLDTELAEVADRISVSRVSEYKVYNIQDKEYLVSTEFIPLYKNDLQLIYYTDISEIYVERELQYSFYLKLSIVVIFLITVGMYFIVRYLTTSLRILTKAAQNIGEGNYTERISIKSKDEIGKLIQSHNYMAEAIEEKVTELESKNVEQQRFIDNFTHELRTPLTAVIGYADLLRSMNFTEEETQELSQNIFKEGKRIEKLSERMMDLVFLNRNAFTLVSCDMRDIILETKEQFKTILNREKIEMISEIPNYPIMILADRDLMIHLLGNLVDNAKKASAEGGSIFLRGCMENGCALFEVEDQGCGIPMEDQERIFERFYMVDQVRNGKNKGVGLGLSICADITKILNARLEILSKENKGTLVKIYMPCYKDDTKNIYNKLCKEQIKGE